MYTYFKNNVIAGAKILTLISLASASWAGEGEFSAGLKLGSLDLDNAGSETATGVQLGYRVNNRVAAELEILQADFGNADLDSTAIFGTYRTRGDKYLLGKIGFVDLDAGGQSESGLGYGFGGGIAVNSTFTVEAEYTILDSDVTFFGLTGKMSF